LIYQDYFRGGIMPTVKISSKIEEEIWRDLKSFAGDTHQSVSGLLTEAVREFLERRRVRPVVLEKLKRSLDENEELGKLLAR
jgi:predicted transcriptional regulator